MTPFQGFPFPTPPRGGISGEMEQFRSEIRGQQEQALCDRREQFALFQSQLFQQTMVPTNSYRAEENRVHFTPLEVRSNYWQ